MVLEAVGTLSLACNILQITEYGARIVGKAVTLHHSTQEGINEINDLDRISQ